jgi:hypothetical protein
MIIKIYISFFFEAHKHSIFGNILWKWRKNSTLHLHYKILNEILYLI